VHVQRKKPIAIQTLTLSVAQNDQGLFANEGAFVSRQILLIVQMRKGVNGCRSWGHGLTFL